MDPFTHLGVDVVSQKHKKKKGMRDRIRLVMNVMCSSPPQHCYNHLFTSVTHTIPTNHSHTLQNKKQLSLLKFPPSLPPPSCSTSINALQNEGGAQEEVEEEHGGK